MTEKKQEQNEQTIHELPEQELEEVSGGYFTIGSDSQYCLDYEKSGVRWISHTWSKDEYYFRGEKISQDMAGKIVTAYRQLGRQITDQQWQAFKAGDFSLIFFA